MELVLNRPTVNTFGWLHSNGTPVTACVNDSVSLQEECPEGIAGIWEEPGDVWNMRTGAGQDAAALLRNTDRRVYHIAAGRQVPGVLRLHYSFDRPDSGTRVSFELEENSALTVIMDYSGGSSAAAIGTQIRLGKNASLHLTQIQRTGQAVFINDIGAECGEDSAFSLIRLILDGGETYDGCSVELRGDRSVFHGDIGYRARGRERLDMNYEAVHKGRNTESEMNVSGVLSEEAFKLFRGTIDLQRGCAGAVGNELENVLMMDDTTRNQTIPVILCGEEDVVGNHGATIGRLDEELIFYLESRGVDRDSIYDMMARARIEAVIRKIPDETTVAALLPENEG